MLDGNVWVLPGGSTAVKFPSGSFTFASGATYNVTGSTAVTGGTLTFNSGSTVTAVGALTLSARNTQRRAEQAEREWRALGFGKHELEGPQ